jgi:hypothetical protein
VWKEAVRKLSERTGVREEWRSEGEDRSEKGVRERSEEQEGARSWRVKGEDRRERKRERRQGGGKEVGVLGGISNVSLQLCHVAS